MAQACDGSSSVDRSLDKDPYACSHLQCAGDVERNLVKLVSC